MNKQTWMALLLAAGTLPMAAQEANEYPEETVEYSNDKYKVETNHFWSNWFISAGAGAQVYFGDHDKQCKLKHRLSPALDVAVGKWFTPGLGVRIMYSGLNIKGATQFDQSHSTGEEVPGKGGHGYWLTKQKFSMQHLHMDFMFNLSNLICGYNEKRVWNISPYVGLGWAHVGRSPKVNDITGNFGLLNTWRLCKSLDANLDVRAMIVNDDFDGEIGGRKGEAMLSATIGLTYKFPQRGWNRSKTVVRYNNEALDEMRRKLNEMSEENNRLREALAANDKQQAEVHAKQIAAGNLIIFKIGKSTLSKEARANLGMFAEVIKNSDEKAVYTITGYADKGTGSKKRNEQLSRQRAEAVYDCLVNEFGVNKDQLHIDYKGGVDNMFYNDPRLSRAVITRGK